jgi:SAM-dependent methyltransferase
LNEQLSRDLLAAEAEARMSTGWDLSSLGMRELGEPCAWDYEQLARDELSRSLSAVDLGTGGGEVLLRVAEAAGGALFATEQWGPNARLAHSRLKEHGIPLVWCEAEGRRMPFRSAAFDLVLDRHEALDPIEVDRVLAPGGVVLTQQVTSRSMQELRRYIPRATVFPNHDEEYAASFRAMGYEVEVQRREIRVAFPALASLVRFLVVAPWTVPDFSVERDLDALRHLERELATSEGIVLSDGRYLLKGKKPG